MILKVDKKNKFYSRFDPDTGYYERSGIIEDGKDTGVDPFMASFPELLDIGIMSRCACAHKCNVDCYQKAIDSTGVNMSLENYEKIMKECKDKLFQCLEENEVLLIKNGDYVKSANIKDVRVGDKIYCGGNIFSTVTEKHESLSEIYDIELVYGKHIYATGEHKFPVKNVLKRVDELNIGDVLLHTKKDFNIDCVEQIDIVKMIIARGLGKHFYLSDCPGMKEICEKHSIFRNTKKTVRIDRIADYLGMLDYSRALISRERSQYRFKTIYEVTEDFMLLLGHYIGNGSNRRYTISNTQEKMIKSIENALLSTFPNFTFTKRYENNVCIFELNSALAHGLLFDEVFECRTSSREKQIPNFIFSLDKKRKFAFLKGYFCDGNLRCHTKDGNYGEIVFNTSSNKLYKDVCLLLSSLDVDYSVATEKGKQEIFSNSEPRTIDRKRRYRIRINNLKEINKIQEIVSDHKNSEKFYEIINVPHNEKYLRDRKEYEIKSIKKMDEKARVIDININSENHLFITSHGIITHNCALGGKGDVDTHENFEEILKMTREHNIVPNFTTSGIMITKEKAEICKKYCGAVAVSWHGADYTNNAINLLLEAGVNTSIHFVLSNKSIDLAIDMMKNNKFPKGITAVIYLLYKPVGLGKTENMLTTDNSKVKEFFEIIDNNTFDFKIGFDSCSTSGLINFTKNINPESFDTCEGSRFSAYITPDMKMLPCSFDNQELRWAYDISNDTIQNAWDSEQFEDFRSHFHKSCSGCSSRRECMGSCPIRREIILCDRKEKNLYESQTRFCN